MFKVVNTWESPEYLTPLQNYVKTISGLRSENYINLKVDRASAWWILYDGKWIVGFSGVQIPDSWQNKRVARMLYRTYLAPEVRGKGMKPTRHNWHYSGELQINFCKSFGLTPVISRENTGLSNSSRNIVKTANEYTGEKKWTLLPGYYYTCKGEPNDNPKCWQKLVCYGDTRHVQKLPHKMVL
tara:strand:+ start:3426 stop:3977 length:552 start_codon:yes stop_codon:yes gene_type:complete